MSFRGALKLKEDQVRTQLREVKANNLVCVPEAVNKNWKSKFTKTSSWNGEIAVLIVISITISASVIEFKVNWNNCFRICFLEVSSKMFNWNCFESLSGFVRSMWFFRNHGESFKVSWLFCETKQSENSKTHFTRFKNQRLASSEIKFLKTYESSFKECHSPFMYRCFYVSINKMKIDTLSLLARRKYPEKYFREISPLKHCSKTFANENKIRLNY